MKTIKTTNFIQKALSIHGDKYLYNEVEYINYSTKVKIKCPKHGVWEVTPDSHLKGSNCPKCIREKLSLSTEEFNQRVQSIHGDKYIYDEIEYINMYSKVKIKCPKHGVWYPIAKDFLSGCGCPKCAKENFGLDKTITTEEFIQKALSIHGDKYIYDEVEYINNYTKIKIKCSKHGVWKTKPNNHISSKSGCPKCSNIISKPELEIIEFIKSLIPNIQVINSNKNVLNGKELDIYLPEYNIAIEYNGLMWHSIGYSEYNMFNTFNRKDLMINHLLKTQECENQGIQLFHIFENEWINEPEKWKNVIQDKLGLNKKIGARKTQIRPVQAKEARVFEDKNHLQGSGLSSIRYGLFYKEELICLMTFGKSRMSKMYEYELIRFCSKQGVTVQGGASKLLKHFERKHQPMSLVSYANRRWSQGNLYKTLGFELANISSPNHFYFKVNNLKLESRQKYQKHKLHKVLSNFNQKLSGIQNMLNNDFRIIYDSGNFVFYKKYSG